MQTRGLIERAESVRASIADNLEAAETSLETRTEAALGRWREASTSATERFLMVANDAVATIDQRGGSLGDRLATSVQLFDQNATVAASQIHLTASNATDRLATAAAEASAVISLSAEGLNDRLVTSTNAFEEQTATALSRWSEIASGTSEKFSAVAFDAVSSISGKSGEIGGELASRAATFEKRALDAMSRINEAANVATSALATAASEASSTFNQHSERLGDRTRIAIFCLRSGGCPITGSGRSLLSWRRS